MKAIYSLFMFICFCQAVFGQEAIPAQFSYKEINVKGNSADWVSSGILVKKSDYVVFEVLGQVKLGSWIGWIYGDGSFNPFYFQYNRLDSLAHGAVVCKNGDKLIPARNSNYFNLLKPADKLSWGIGFKEDSFIGYYFISKETQELKFIINDRDYQNNEGSFDIKITVIPLSVHISRNRLFNKCPRIQPLFCSDGSLISNELDSLYVDVKNNVWVSSWKEKWYHGGKFFLSKTYRGVSTEVAGCQCTYNSDGLLVNDNIYAGTYDFAFGIKGLNSRLKYHTLWDVFPHDLFVDYFKTEKGNQFLYEPTKNIY